MRRSRVTMIPPHRGKGFIYKCILMVVAVMQILTAIPVATAQSNCLSDRDCEALYRSGSTCLPSGMCSNPFTEGCLKRMMVLENDDHEPPQTRLCNSDDDTTAEDINCRTSQLNYPEVRVHYQNWEVAIFFSWILQISLMELLDVPVKVGLGSDTKDASFYNIDNKLLYSPVGYSWDGLRKANELNGDCLQTEEDCVHVLPDAWVSQADILNKEYEDGQLDYLDGNGQIGKDSLFLPKFTAQQYPFAVTYHGLSQNRQLLAEIFKRPTTWADYCHEVSLNNCTVPDGIADRYPNEADMGKYFSREGYIGHFRATAENICTGAQNDTCTGHAVAPPCDWSTFLEGQAFWLKMALKSSGPNHVNGGYGYGEMIQIWNAANATKSHVIMHWFEPDAVVEVFRNTDFEFTRIYLPPASLQCKEERLSVADRCSADPMVRRGTEVGSCDNGAHVTKKVIARSLRDSTLEAALVDQSPAYSFIQNFNMDQLEINEMLGHFVANGRNGYAAREAVCSWVANNTDYLKSLMPPNHPKVFRSREDYAQTVTIAAYILGFITLAYIVVCSAVSFKKRKAAVFVYSQVRFIFVMLFGLFLVAIGAIMNGIEPDDTICMTRVWLVSLGYTFELVPLIIKVTALNHLMKASKKMRRVQINRQQLYTSLLVLSGIVALYLIVWTAVDPSKATEVRKLEDDRTTVTSHFGCRSSSPYWNIIYLIWESILILWCSVLAFQSRNVQAEFNESKSLGMMIYSHFIFLALRVIVSLVFDDDAYTSSIATSYLLSLDIIVALMIYLVPKMVMPSETIQQQQNRGRANYSAATSQIHQQARVNSPTAQKPSLSSSFQYSLNHTESTTMADEMPSIPWKPPVIYENNSDDESLDGSERKQEHGGLTPMHPKSSVGLWVKDAGAGAEPSSTDPLPANSRRFDPEAGVAGDEELREHLLQMNNELQEKDSQILEKDTELAQLKRRVGALQEIKARQASEIEQLMMKKDP
ncbi:unnamed protein product [Cylindrotheca closterium]|uniref:G-protein coupled receptors family 3 profile domain-containing protein n=1 Tax=Cylindrotheca closterium TaxID=2856 RepID=A0AAD2JNX2_9STRA|nr:unnamed protein product [Cylindrotheca closterium]